MKRWMYMVVGLVGLGACASVPTSSEWLARADGYVKDGKPAAALKAYNKAIALNPKNLEAYASRGAAHFFNGNFALAQQDFEYVLKQNPYHADTYNAYGSALAAQGYFNEALQAFDISLRLRPNKPETFFSRAGVFFMLGRYNEAIIDYTSVINLRPAVEVYNARGAAYLRAGKPKQAEQDFNTAKNGHLPQTLNVYSMIQ